MIEPDILLGSFLNNNNLYLRAGVCLSLLSLLIGLVSCSKSDLHNNSSGSISQTGKLNYDRYCAACHGSLERSSKVGRNASDIQSAIQNIIEMRSIAIDASGIDSIVYVLDPANRIQVLDGLVSSYHLPVKNSQQIASAFNKLFVNFTQPNAQDVQIQQIIKEKIADQRIALGASCNRYDDECGGNHLVDIALTPPVDILRKGYTTLACNQILEIDRAVENVLSKMNITINTAPQNTQLDIIFEHFYGRVVTDPAVRNAVQAIYSEAQRQGMAPIDAWRFTLLPICTSSMMDLL